VGWLSGWSYRRPITIDNTQNPDDLQDYQILVIVDTASLISEGKLRSDAGDLRFTDEDGVTLLNYWVEGPVNDPNTRVWVKVPLIPGSGTKTIYMYYGNPDATSESDPDSVMELYDHFDSWDTSKWNGNYNDLSNSIIKHYGTCSYSVKSFGPGHRLRMKAYFDMRKSGGEQSGGGFQGDDHIGAWDGAPANAVLYLSWGSGDLLRSRKDGNEQTLSASYRNAWKIFEIRWVSGKVEGLIEDSSIGTITDPAYIPTVSLLVQLHARGSPNQDSFQCDWIYVTKYTDPEPSVSVGSEQTPPKPTVLTLQVIPL